MGNRCTLCPRHCGADRTFPSHGKECLQDGTPSLSSEIQNSKFKIQNSKPFCGAPSSLAVASVCLHRGEEPPLNPIVNIFFSHCNLHCIYCQNWQISGQHPVDTSQQAITTVNQLADQIIQTFKQSSNQTIKQSPLLGFVTAALYADRIPDIIQAIKQSSNQTITPTVVYNSSGYESVATLRSLEGLVDIYLPDFKYMDPSIAAAYSHAPDYPEVATDALREMIRQVGSRIKVDSDGRAYRGLIVRHLVLPGHVDNSLAVLDHLANPSNFNFSSLPTLSLMAQYYPPRPDLPSPLNRTLTPDEYNAVATRYNELGFDGWLQELQAENNYRPDFSQPDHPFETTH